MLVFFPSGTCIHQSCAETFLSAAHRQRHITPSPCRRQRNGSHPPRSVFNACIARKFSRRQACGRMVVSTAKVCLCISTTPERFHAINFTTGTGFFRLSGASPIFDHRFFLKESDTMKSCNSSHLFLSAHPKTLVSLVLSMVPTATVLGDPKCLRNQTKSVMPC